MDFMTTSIILFICASFWGYFDMIMNICFRLKMEIYDKKQGAKLKSDKNLDKKEMLTFFETDESFKVASVIKLSALIAFGVSFFYLSFNHFLIIGMGFFFGRLLPSRMNTLEKISGTENPSETCKKSILYGNIYILYFTLYFISVIIIGQ